MAMTLPKASDAASGSPRKGGSATLPTDLAIARATPQSDPGANVSGSFGSDQFAAVEDVGRAVTSIGVVASNIQRREDGLARSKGDADFVTTTGQIVEDLEATGTVGEIGILDATGGQGL